MKATTFEFSSYKFDIHSREAHFVYTLSFEEGKPIVFTDKLIFPQDAQISKGIPVDLLNDLLHATHLMLGISYWKALCPKEITIHTRALTQQQAEFWNTVYTKGLGEFFYRNEIDFWGLVNFPYKNFQAEEPISFSRKDRALIGVGGGKDSIVAYELLKKIEYPMTGYILETQKKYDVINDVVQVMEIGTLEVTRHIDPQLFELNKQTGVFNGHIPISAIYALTALLSAVLFDYRYYIVANENSANVGNVVWHGEEINHQWSKSEEFEKMLNDYIHTYITPDISYFSLLRPFSEIKIVELFSQYKKYFNTFASCNNNFSINNNQRSSENRWCGKCAKCAFMFMMLGAFLPKDEVVGIFKKNLFEGESLVTLYQELWGLKEVKPWDCVGTFEECKVAMTMIHEKGEFENELVMQMFVKDVLPKIENGDRLKEEVFEVKEAVNMPERFKSIIS